MRGGEEEEPKTQFELYNCWVARVRRVFCDESTEENRHVTSALVLIQARFQECTAQYPPRADRAIILRGLIAKFTGVALAGSPRQDLGFRTWLPLPAI
jgi:hypothetical protein